jgi:hypothetical protein
MMIPIDRLKKTASSFKNINGVLRNLKILVKYYFERGYKYFLVNMEALVSGRKTMTKNKYHWYDGAFFDIFIAPNQDKLFGQIKNLINP